MIPVSVVWRVVGWSLITAAIGLAIGHFVGFEYPWVTALIAGVWMFVWSIRVEARKVGR